MCYKNAPIPPQQRDHHFLSGGVLYGCIGYETAHWDRAEEEGSLLPYPSFDGAHLSALHRRQRREDHSQTAQSQKVLGLGENGWATQNEEGTNKEKEVEAPPWIGGMIPRMTTNLKSRLHRESLPRHRREFDLASLNPRLRTMQFTVAEVRQIELAAKRSGCARGDVVFDNDKVLDSVVNSGWEFGGQATAAAKTGDKGAAMTGAASVSDGIWLYQMTDKGLAAEITVKSTKYYKDDDLN
jgi:hypothetical protein